MQVQGLAELTSRPVRLSGLQTLDLQTRLLPISGCKLQVVDETDRI